MRMCVLTAAFGADGLLPGLVWACCNSGVRHGELDFCAGAIDL